MPHIVRASKLYSVTVDLKNRHDAQRIERQFGPGVVG